MTVVLCAILGYLIGAIPFGYIVAKLARGIDIREHGSGNIGATNVGRVLGIKWFFIVFFLDFAKAAIPVSLVAYRITPALIPQDWPAVALASLVGLAVLLGNMFPIYLGFKGGKGAATGTGVMLPLAPIPLLAAVAAFLFFFLFTRYVSLGSIAAAIALVISQLILLGSSAFSTDAAPITWLCIIGAVLVIYRHRKNIIRLLKGTESKIVRNSPTRNSQA